jgi:AcrR family transcriptional regulator
MKVQDPAVFSIRKDTILQHARHLFATKGVAETTMDDIAQACKMQKASLYHYFASKDGILRELIDQGCARWASRIRGGNQGQTLDETLRFVATAFLDEMKDPGRREFFKILHFESHKNPWILKAWKESPMQNREGFYTMFAQHLDGKLDRPKIAMFIFQFMGALVHYTTVAKIRGENMCHEVVDDPSYIEQLVTIFGNGIKAVV